ncbi:MAG: hypothetical protein ACN4E6_18760 [Qipengyuania pacifica]
MKKARDDAADDAPPDREASAEATGGIGTSYEHVCIAAYLSALLTRSHAPACPGIVTSIALQQKANKRPLDDIVIGWKDDAGREGTVDLQLKRRLSVSAKQDSDFSRIVTDAWTTMKRTDFVDRRDLAGGLSEVVSSANHYACQKLRELAAEADQAGFAAPLATQVDGAARKAIAAVQEILTRTLGTAPTQEDSHFFWRNFVIGRLEATAHLGIDRLRAIDLLSRITQQDGVNPTQLFAVLEALARQLNVHAAQIDRETLISLLEERFGTRVAPVPGDLPDALESGRRGAMLELEEFRAQALAQLIDPIFTTREGEGRQAAERTVRLDAVEADLRASRSIVVVGEPGAGKSSALAQIAVTLLRQPGLVPIVRSLPSLAQHKTPIVSQVCGKGSFADFSEAHFAALARSAQIILLFDGWNELNPEQRLWAWSELEALRRDHPALLLVIATRAGTASPFSQATSLEIHLFDRNRQLKAAARLLGPLGHDIVIRARAIPALRPLLRTPLFLSAILQQGASGNLPTDRETAIAGLVASAGGTPARREQLRLALDGQHGIFLQVIADQLMTAGTTFTPEAALLPVIGAVAGDLKASQLLVQPISAQGVLDLLISHHVLVGTGAPGERTISFQHQLIQEWFASHRVEAAIENQGDSAVAAALRSVINAPFWSVTLLFAVDRLSRSTRAEAPLRMLILTTLGIEPFLAADMFVRARDCFGAALDEDLIAFATRWVEEDPARATKFMLATGLPQFADQLWATLKQSKELAFDLHRSGRSFPVSALEPHWDQRFPELDSQTRRVLLIDLVEQGDVASLALSQGAAAKDPSVDVVSGVIDYLDFRDERASLEHLLDRLPKSMWVELSRGREPDNLTDRHRTCWQRHRRKRFEHAEGFEWINLALEFDCAAPAAIVKAGLDLKSDSHWSSYELEQRLFDRFPEVFQASLVSRLLRGGSLPYRPWQYLHDVEPSEQSALLAIAQAKDENFHRRQLAAQLLGRDAVAELVDHIVSCAGDRDALRTPQTQVVRDVLRSVRPDLLLSDVLGRTVDDAVDAAVLISVLADWRSADDERRFALSPQDRETLIQRVQDWAVLLLAQSDVRRSELAEFARVIDRIADVALLPTLLILWDRDRTQQAEERAARAAAPHGARASEAHMSYGNQYRAAALAIGGDAVIKAMIGRLDDPDCEHDAAVVLGQLLEVDPVERGPMGAKMDDLATRHARLLKRRTSAPHPVAAKLIDRIDALVALGDIDSITRAFQLAGPLTLLNYGDRGPSLLKLIEVGKDHGLLRDFCKAFSERGEPLPAHIVRHGISTGIAALAAMKWVHDSEYWRVEDWLRLIAFADDAEAALPPFDALPAELVHRYRLRDLVYQIGHSISATAVTALVELLRRSPGLFNDGWPEAMARIGSPEAGNALLDAFQAAPGDTEEWRDTYPLRQSLAAVVAHAGEVRTRAMSLLGEIRHAAKQATLADALAQTMDEQDAIQLLTYAAEPDGAVMARVLIDRLEHAAVSRLPIQGMPNTFELEGAPLSRFRQLAFRRLLKKPEHPGLRSCLQAIDHLRDEYGKPVTEPHHPDIESGCPWPSAAEPIWLALGYRANGTP